MQNVVFSVTPVKPVKAGKESPHPIHTEPLLPPMMEDLQVIQSASTGRWLRHWVQRCLNNLGCRTGPRGRVRSGLRGRVRARTADGACACA